MLKKYKAKSHVCLNVGGAHVSFSMLTGGGSVFYTENEQLQKALEKHPKFGRLFKLDEVVETVKKVEAVQTEQPKEEEPSKRQIEVTCADDAKEYLVEKYGISRTKLRSLKSIKDTAEQKGIEFIGID